MKKVLVTGMNGLIGGTLKEHLGSQYDMYALNRRKMEGTQCFQADIADLEAIKPAFNGMDVVVHLAATSGLASSATAMPSNFDDLLNTNIVGTYNVFEAARASNVKRVIFFSTGWVTESGVITTDYEPVSPYNLISDGDYDKAPKSFPLVTHETPLRPANLYACTKVWGEAVARYFSDSQNMSVIVIRSGGVREKDEPLFPRDWPTWCSKRDISQMVKKSIDADDSLRFGIFFAVSNNKWGFRDLKHAKDILGFEPEDDAEMHRN